MGKLNRMKNHPPADVFTAALTKMVKIALGRLIEFTKKKTKVETINYCVRGTRDT